MSTQEYSAILVRLDGLERQVRWRNFERLLTAALLGWLLASGPAAFSPRERWSSLRLPGGGISARAAFEWSSAELRTLVTVRPVLDPQTVLEDEREARGESQAPARLLPSAQRTAAALTKGRPLPAQGHALPAAGHVGISRAARARADSINGETQRRIAGNRDLASNPVRAAVSLPAPMPTADRTSTSHSDFGAGIREAERSLARASENGPKLASMIPGAVRAIPKSWTPSSEKSAGFATSVPATLTLAPPELPVRSSSRPAAAEPLSSGALAEPTAPAATVSLKALGYARSADGAQAILTDGATLYVVNEGEEFADRFRVTEIRPEGLEIEDRRANTTFQLAFGH